ncbi:hypothetical protein QF035_000317 [Streptomyces umbrinus]|uniref:Uncharacterized protein n=1 Tax=Streptomyces umbrinus TaxID=67370 RepID=A0ABU0SGP6_9ACTN|nr:hypothetical protein [Streptomyces umbrinus]MDQ1022735.1 hypothetical protein [Streptomyces umbrinus]
MITERHNSMIARTCACLAAGCHHHAYPRALIVEHIRAGYELLDDPG